MPYDIVGLGLNLCAVRNFHVFGVTDSKIYDNDNLWSSSCLSHFSDCWVRISGTGGTIVARV